MPAVDARNLRHFSGGRKGAFLLLRYLFIASAAYLIVFQRPLEQVEPTQALMICIALSSNVLLSVLPSQRIFSWYVEAPVLIADTLWVAWALHSTGAGGQDLFLLYLFVLSLAALGENLLMVLAGSTLVSIVNLYVTAEGPWTSSALLRVVFFYCVALFYGHVVSEIKRERQRADKGLAWAKELETMVDLRTAELSRLYRDAQATNRLKSEFLANVSHELRTPLHIILGYGELLLDPTTAMRDSERAEMVTRILDAAREQVHLVDTVLDLGRAESGKMPVDLRAVPLRRVLDALARKQRLPASESVSMRWELPAELPVVETDPTKLSTVLDNLINNALKFTRAGSVTVGAVDLPEQRQVALTVADTGPGIPPDDLERIFEPFHQIDGSPSSRHGGVGLGLAIVASYVRLLGGQVAVESRLGSGTTFTVHLPYRRALAAPDGAGAARPSQAVPAAGRATRTGAEAREPSLTFSPRGSS